jgi:hypothetical protein
MPPAGVPGNNSSAQKKAKKKPTNRPAFSFDWSMSKRSGSDVEIVLAIGVLIENIGHVCLALRA